MNSSNSTILFTVDVEDWFQVENFRQWIPFETWNRCELRVEQNVNRLLDLLDSFVVQRNTEGRQRQTEKLEGKRTNILKDKEISDYELFRMNCQVSSDRSCMSYEKSQPKATFFVLGLIAGKLPHLVREIHARGHEVASHGFNHNLCNQLSPADLMRDLSDSKKLLEDIIGSPVAGYRAPNFSVSDDILKTVEDSGFRYDSSYNSFGLHRRYGKTSLHGFAKSGIAYRVTENFFELPVSNIKLNSNSHRPLKKLCRCKRDLTSRKKKIVTTPEKQAPRFTGSNAELGQRGMFDDGLILPWGGGAYFRLIPFSIFRIGVKTILRRQHTYLFYTHPWEVDPEQPRVEEASANFKFRHYSNLSKTQSRLRRLFNSFQSCRFSTCSRYLDETATND